MDSNLKYKTLFENFENWYGDVLLYNFKLKFLFVTLLVVNLVSGLMCFSIYHGITPIVETLEVVIDTDRNEKEEDITIVKMNEDGVDPIYNLASYLVSQYIIQRESINIDESNTGLVILEKEKFIKQNSSEDAWDSFKKVHTDIRNQNSLLYAAMLKINRKASISSKILKKKHTVFRALYEKMIPSFKLPNEFWYTIEVQDGNLAKKKFDIDVEFIFDIIVSDTVSVMFEVTKYTKYEKNS
jgi:type IV secretory pathway component VirB8